MNSENVPTWSAARMPPFHRTSASAQDEARFVTMENAPYVLADCSTLCFMLDVSAMKSASIFSSIASDLMVLAPVMPSLKLPVIFELISRIWWCRSNSLPWNIAKNTAMMGTTRKTYPVSLTSMLSMMTAAPTMYSRK